MDQIRSDLSEMKQDVKELIRQGAVHNELLRTHEARSLALQKALELQGQEMAPIKQHVNTVNTMGKAALAILTGTAIALLTKLALAALHLI